MLNLNVAYASNNFLNENRSELTNGADVNAKDKYGWSVLMSASRYGYKDIVELLIKKGANSNFGTKSVYKKNIQMNV